MEVHSHTHTPRRKWTHYFWEFLMLFLAVFCGFLAENEREHMIENKRAKQLAKNLYKEIYADSINVQLKITYRNKKEEECTYFISYVKDSNLAILSPRFYPAFTWAFIQTTQLQFEPNDGILNQLRNSGELRYFKNSELQAAIGRLSVSIANIRNRNDKEYSFLEMNIRPFSVKHYDFDWYESLTRYGQLTLMDGLNQNIQGLSAGKIMDPVKFNRKEAENIASYYLLMLRGTRQGHYIHYANVNHQLLQILRKEYHLE